MIMSPLRARNRKLLSAYDVHGNKLELSGNNQKDRKKHCYDAPRNWTMWQGWGNGKCVKTAEQREKLARKAR
jgi:hypothetical protein